MVGADITDYFNYGFTEQTWREYCLKQKTLRDEYGAQKKIAVFDGSESMIPKLPPNLPPGIPPFPFPPRTTGPGQPAFPFPPPPFMFPPPPTVKSDVKPEESKLDRSRDDDDREKDRQSSSRRSRRDRRSVSPSRSRSRSRDRGSKRRR